MGRCRPEVGSAARCLERLSAAGPRAQAGRPGAGPSVRGEGPEYSCCIVIRLHGVVTTTPVPALAPLSCHLLHEPCPSPQTRWIFPSAHNALYYQTQPLSMRFVFVYVSYGAYEFCTALGT